ncbi:MAG: low molecular weight phosphatase family protein, partial [Pseudomonadota bacterium]
RLYHLDVVYWPIMDPTGLAEGRAAKLDAYRQTRDQISERMTALWGVPEATDI